MEAIDAKIIPTSKIFIEKRVVLKCRGCIGYGILILTSTCGYANYEIQK
jgi:predicted metal-binding protein